MTDDERKQYLVDLEALEASGRTLALDPLTPQEAFYLLRHFQISSRHGLGLGEIERKIAGEIERRIGVTDALKKAAALGWQPEPEPEDEPAPKPKPQPHKKAVKRAR